MSGVPPFADELGGTLEPPDDELLAAELVLGLLDAAAHRATSERRLRDPAFAARVKAWELRFSPWLAEITPVTVPAHLWTQLKARLGWQDSQPRAGLWNSLTLWRSATALAVLSAIAIWIFNPPGRPIGGEAALTKPVTPLTRDGATEWLASVDRSEGSVLMVPVPRAADEQGRVAELWIIPSGKAPVSLGAVSFTRAHTVQVPPDDRAALVAPGSVLAITLEPAAGVPHGAPSGPVIAQGAIRM